MKYGHPVALGTGLVCAFAGAPAGMAQTEAENLGEITVTSPRVEKPINEVPYAIDLVDKDDIQLGTQQLGLDESLTKIPGIFMLNRYNFSQDLRIAIRGFGARANFGIRGIKIIVDGIPQTLPDGQGGIDAIDLASAERIEVIRGPSSSLYGASSGGVINIVTEEGPEIPFVEGRYSGGSYGFHKYNLKTGGQYGDLNYLFNIGRYEIDGYRDHSQSESVIGNGKFIYDIDETSDFTTVINFVDSPVADDPGGLTLEEVQQDRRQARPQSLQFDGGEAQEQQRVGFVYRKQLAPRHEIRLRNYYALTDFENKLPFQNGAQVDFQRFFFGGGAQYTYTGDRNRFTVGVDVDDQTDDRFNYDNNNGVRGTLRLHQEEAVNSVGIYAQNEFKVTDTVELTTGVRYDRVDFEVSDRFLSDGDDSGSTEFDEVSPTVGLRWSPTEQVNFYGNVSQSFETPTTTEFANPAGGGFNQSLQPQTATQYELGIKGYVPQLWFLTYDAAVYHIDIKDELVPFALAGQPGRDFFNNAGSSERDGFELSLSAEPLPGLTTSFAYTYSRFKYENNQPIIPIGGFPGTPTQFNFNGNYLPGIPEHLGHFEIAYNHPSGYYAIWDTLLVSELYTDDSNTTKVPGYGVSNIRAGFVKNIGGTEISPFVGVNNIFDKEYFSNIRINDAFNPTGRFYEPAPEINFYAGFSVRHNFL